MNCQKLPKIHSKWQCLMIEKNSKRKDQIEYNKRDENLIFIAVRLYLNFI